MTIPCKAEDGWMCPYIKTCLARLNDPSIVGCGYPLYLNGLIRKSDILVSHRIVQDAPEKPRPKKKKRGG